MDYTTTMQKITTRKTRGKTTKAKDPEDQVGVREYDGIHKISKEKYKDIIELMKIVPPIYHNFYINLPQN